VRLNDGASTKALLPRNPFTAAWERNSRALTTGLAVLVLAELAILGLLLVTHHDSAVYGMSSSRQVTLPDGRPAPTSTLSITAALALQPRRRRYVRGYLLRPRPASQALVVTPLAGQSRFRASRYPSSR
jgi:hypothetical protein